MELTAAATPGAGTRIRNFPGTYDYYLYRIAAEENSSAPEIFGSRSGKISAISANASAAPVPSSQAAPENMGSQALSYEEQKKQRAEKRRREKEEERILTQISEAEDRIKELESRLASPDVYADGEKVRSIQQQIQALQETAAALTDEWEALAQDA